MLCLNRMSKRGKGIAKQESEPVVALPVLNGLDRRDTNVSRWRLRCNYILKAKSYRTLPFIC